MDQSDYTRDPKEDEKQSIRNMIIKDTSLKVRIHMNKSLFHNTIQI